MGVFMALFISFYMSSWVIFSYFYWLDAKIRGDIDYYAAKAQLSEIQTGFNATKFNSTKFAALTNGQLMELGFDESFLQYVRDERGRLLLTEKDYEASDA